MMMTHYSHALYVDDSTSDDLVVVEAEGFEIETFWQEAEQKVVNIRNSTCVNLCKVNADGIDLSIFKPLLTCREYTFALHLTNVGIEAIEANDIGPNWFRSLSLVGSPSSTSLSNEFDHASTFGCFFGNITSKF